MTATATTPVSFEERRRATSAEAPPSADAEVRRSRCPSWVWYLGFFVVPVMVIVWYSFGYKPPVNAGRGPIATDHLSLQNYRDALSDTFFKTFQNTFSVAIIGTALCLLIGFPVAYFIAVKVPAKWRGLMLGLVIVPFWTSFLIRTIAWRIVLAPKASSRNWLQTMGLRGTRRSASSTRARPCSSASSTTTCR